MSYIIQVVVPALPQDKRMAFEAADAIVADMDDDDGTHPLLVRLHDVVTAVYPCLSHYGSDDPAIADCPWSDGPLIGNVGAHAAVFGLRSGRFMEEASSFIPSVARLLGLTTLDPQQNVISRPAIPSPDERHEVVVTNVRRGFDKDTVVAALARASRRSEDDMRKLFDRPTPYVKRGLDPLGAVQYAQMFRKLGCTSLVSIDTPSSAIARTGGNSNAALERLRDSAQQGIAASQYVLGLLLLDGIDCTQDLALAVAWFERAANQDHVPSLIALADCHSTGKGVPMSKAWAMRWTRKAAELGDVQAQLSVGTSCLEGDLGRSDPVEAERWFGLAANKGNEQAQYQLGSLLRSGQLSGGARPLEAMGWLRKAGERGHTEAQLAVADMLWNGEGGIARDQAEAVTWFRHAAANGSAWAQSHLGLCHEHGVTMARDSGKALHWYRLAAEQGHALAQVRVGNSYRDGVDVPQDLKQAYGWFVRAANQEYVEAQLSLGQLYLEGFVRPGENSRERARFWMQKAAANGDEIAVNMLKIMRR